MGPDQSQRGRGTVTSTLPRHKLLVLHTCFPTPPVSKFSKPREPRMPWIFGRPGYLYLPVLGRGLVCSRGGNSLRQEDKQPRFNLKAHWKGCRSGECLATIRAAFSGAT